MLGRGEWQGGVCSGGMYTVPECGGGGELLFFDLVSTTSE